MFRKWLARRPAKKADAPEVSEVCHGSESTSGSAAIGPVGHAPGGLLRSALWLKK
jgi:hypothetical protein